MLKCFMPVLSSQRIRREFGKTGTRCGMPCPPVAACASGGTDARGTPVQGDASAPRHRSTTRLLVTYTSPDRVLVTGGAGFIGSHLCERLLGQGAEVVCVDNYYTGRRENIRTLLGHPRFETVRHDVTFPLHAEVDRIYNLACPASPVHYQFDPVQTTKTSVVGAINMLGLAKRLKVPILQASTSEVYGDPDVHPQPEGYWGRVNPVGIRSCYDEGKRCAETLFFDYRRQHTLAIKVIRIFNTYGPRMHPDDGRVVSNFICQALKGEPITLYGDGEQTRSFCYVDDLVDGMIAMMATPDATTGPINLGNPGEFTMRELAEIVRELVGSSVAIVHRPLPQDDPRQRKPDIAKAQAELGWTPTVPLREGLGRTIAYFDTLLGTGRLARAEPDRVASIR
ncbi:MAG: UDP-glucuronic acid decarboxylase family protein [Janthinobacterium lividum]